MEVTMHRGIKTARVLLQTAIQRLMLLFSQLYRLLELIIAVLVKTYHLIPSKSSKPPDISTAPPRILDATLPIGLST